MDGEYQPRRALKIFSINEKQFAAVCRGYWKDFEKKEVGLDIYDISDPTAP